MRWGHAVVVVVSVACGCKKEPLAIDAGPASSVVTGAKAAPHEAGRDLSEPAGDETFVVKMERGRCYGLCPVYTVEISADGSVRYDGRAYVAVRGVEWTRTGPEVVAALVARLDESGFFRMTWKDPCELMTTDHEDVTTTFVHHGRKRTIRHYMGNACFPKVLTELEKEIDGVAGAAKRTSCEGGFCMK